VSRADCVFCRIADGELRAAVVYQDDHVVAFKDANPQAPVHLLVVPREHFDSLRDEIPPEVLGALLAGVRRVAEVELIADSGYRIIANSGPDSNQTVGHLHIHVLGGRPMSHGMVNFR
jgi:histidine triad (HIT) family protein